MACKNTTCKYNDAASPNGCKLFNGESWRQCRRAVVTQTRINSTKAKARK